MRFDDTELRRILSARPSRRIRDASLVHAAVLIGLMEIGAESHFLLTRRTDLVESHKGQVAFPGGVVEKGERAEEAALREAEEEIGLLPRNVTILGTIDDMRTPTGYIITPVVARVTQNGAFRPSADEVARIFTAPVALFLDEQRVRVEDRWFEGKMHEVYYYDHDGETIWGVTAHIIRAFLRTACPPEGLA